jgi:DNA-binding response OmpR family regulator
MAKNLPTRLLVVDQDTRYGEWLKHHLDVLCPDSLVSVLALTDFERWSEELSGRDCDVLMLSASFGSSPEDPQAQGLELLRQLREKQQFPAVIAVADEGNELTAVRALQLGAVDYLPKRLLTPERLKTSVRLAMRMIEKRVARRIASLAYTSDGDSKSVVLPAGMAVTKKPGMGDATAAKAARPAAAGTTAPARTSVLPETDNVTATATARAGSQPEANSAAAPKGRPAGTHPTDTPPRPDAHTGGAFKDRPARTNPTGTPPRPEATEAAKSNSRAADSVDATGSRAAAAIGSAMKPEAASGVADSRSADATGSVRKPVASSAALSSLAPAPAFAGSAASAAAALASVAPIPAFATGTFRAVPSDGAPTQPPLEPLPAAKAPGGEFMAANFIPGYTIHATIGESEKAAVYVATSAALNHNIALKVSKTLRDEAAGRQFLQREYTAIVAIRDPSIVQIHDYGIHAGYEYLVMEYLPRGDLKARMQQGLTELEALRYVAQIAAALQVVHHAGLLHRDLKPPNVMLRENGDVALIDFGLARALDGSSASTRTGVLRGSPYYMSPEQAMGEVLDARSDFYSLGIMFYEMLTGKKPYTGGSAMDVLQQHVNAPLPMLPKSLVRYEPLLLKLLAKSREDRFASAQDILVAIAARREADRAAAERESQQAQSSAA